MFGIGLPEMILILALALIVVGPDKLPDLARSLAKGIMELKKTAEGLKEQMNDKDNPLNDIRPDLEDAAKSFKSHMLDHPSNGSTSLFPTEGVNAGDHASNAYEELKKSATRPDGENIIDITKDELTEVVQPAEESTEKPPEESHPQHDSENSTSRK
jgi:sec-independent protein translocase protein TatB